MIDKVNMAPAGAEKLDFTALSNSPTNHFAIVAMVLEEQRTGQEIVQLDGDGIVVELLLNGQHVSFIRAIEEIYRRFESEINERSKQYALNLIDVDDIRQKLDGLHLELEDYIISKFKL